MDSWSDFFNSQLATLLKAVESVSSQLSIALALGLALLPAVPDRSTSIVPAQPPPAQAAPAQAPPAIVVMPKSARPSRSVFGTPVESAPPIEIVRAKPVPAAQAPSMLAEPAAMPKPPKAPGTSSDMEAEADESPAVQLARRSRGRPEQPQLAIQSGDLGKAAKEEPAPAPPPHPKPDTASAPPPEPDVWSDAEIIAALKDCLKRLAPLGAEVEIAAAVKKEECGAPAPVLLKRVGNGPNRVDLQPPPMLNCAMVAGLHRWVEETVQPAAQDILGTRITRLRNVSGYACRNRAGTRSHGDRLSEHALANAVDIGTFVTADGRSIEVARNWGPTVRDIRRREIEVAEAKAAAAKKERERLEDELKSDVEKLEQDKANLPPPPKDKQARREREKLQAELRQREKDLRKREADLRRAEEEEDRELDRRRAIERAPLKSAELSRLGRGTDADRRAIPVAGASGKDDPRRSPEASFLRQLHKGACGPFGTVLGPEANDAHRDHFHLDLAPRRRSAYCE
jgi:hypothetical protein